MVYKAYKPNARFAHFIDAYRMIKREAGDKVTKKVLPDCCADVILNIGRDISGVGGGVEPEKGKTYLVGTMTRVKDIIISSDSELTGVRFKPGVG